MNEEQLLEELISEGESDQLEFKLKCHKEEIARTLCGFLNLKGGRILVGVADNGTVFGLLNPSADERELKQYLFSAIVPEAPITISTELFNDHKILLIKVYGGSKQPYLFDGSIYYRVGAKTVKATSHQIADLIHGRQKSEEHWERKSAGVDLSDLDARLIQSTIKESRKNHRGNYQGNDVLEFLTYYGLFLNGSFTNACVVLFAKHPARFIPQIRVRLTEYGESKTDHALLRDEVYEDNLFVIQDKLETYVVNLGTRSVFENSRWKRSDFRFPSKALQEGLINALMHRDYSSPSSGISVSIYPDSFVISNSGKLPDDLKVSELKKSHRSHPVNPDIAHVVFLRGLIDKLGRGTLKVVEECRSAGLREPIWKQNTDGVTLTFNGPRAMQSKKSNSDDLDEDVFEGVSEHVIDGVSELIIDGVNEGVTDGVTDGIRRELIRIVKLLTNDEGINAMDIVVKTGKSKPTMERYLRLARELRIIEFKGAPKSGGYFLTDKFKEKINE